MLMNLQARGGVTFMWVVSIFKPWTLAQVQDLPPAPNWLSWTLNSLYPSESSLRWVWPSESSFWLSCHSITAKPALSCHHHHVGTADYNRLTLPMIYLLPNQTNISLSYIGTLVERKRESAQQQVEEKEGTGAWRKRRLRHATTVSIRE